MFSLAAVIFLFPVIVPDAFRHPASSPENILPPSFWTLPPGASFPPRPWVPSVPPAVLKRSFSNLPFLFFRSKTVGICRKRQCFPDPFFFNVGSLCSLALAFLPWQHHYAFLDHLNIPMMRRVPPLPPAPNHVPFNPWWFFDPPMLCCVFFPLFFFPIFHSRLCFSTSLQTPFIPFFCAKSARFSPPRPAPYNL